MSEISRAAVTREAAPAWVFVVVRALLTASSGGLVSLGLLHNADALSLVAWAAPGVAAVVWSALEKWWAQYRLRLAIAAPAGLARPPPKPAVSPAPPKESDPMSSAFDFSKLAAAAEAKLKELAPDVAPDFAAALTGAVADVAAEAKTFVDGEIEAATHQVPPALQPFAPEIESLIDAGISEAQAEADAKIAKLAAAKASLSPPPTPAAAAEPALEADPAQAAA